MSPRQLIITHPRLNNKIKIKIVFNTRGDAFMKSSMS